MTWQQRYGWLRALIGDAAVLDIRALAIGRVGMALLLLYDLFIRAHDIRALYSDEGLEPRSAVDPPLLPLFRIYFAFGDVKSLQVVFAVSAVFALALLLGFRTRLVTGVSWVLLVSLQARNGSVNQAGDDLLAMFLFWSLFLPLGAYGSLDARLRPRPVASTLVNGAGPFALSGQLFLLYFITGTLKANSSHWLLGNGIYDALNAQEFVTSFGRWLHPHQYVLKLLSWATLVLEIIGPLVLFVPPRRWRVRLALVLAFLCFHAGISLSMRIGMFSFVCMVGWLFLIPAGAFNRFARLSQSITHPSPAPGPLWAQRLAGTIFAYLVLAAMISDRWPKGKVRDALLKPARAFAWQERWGMFVKPRDDVGFLVAHATLANGTQIDLLRGGEALTWNPPPLVIDLFSNQRWRKMLTGVIKSDNKDRAHRYLQWLCRTENVSRTGRVKVENLVLTYVSQKLVAPYTKAPPERKVLSTSRCQ